MDELPTIVDQLEVSFRDSPVVIQEVIMNRVVLVAAWAVGIVAVAVSLVVIVSAGNSRQLAGIAVSLAILTIVLSRASRRGRTKAHR